MEGGETFVYKTKEEHVGMSYWPIQGLKLVKRKGNLQ